jgi:hypothetical protein
MAKEMHPAVRETLGPIIADVTRIWNRNKVYPMFGPHNEPEQDKVIKKSCVHRIEDERGQWRMAVKKVGEDWICEACGRKINMNFDKNAVDTLMKAIEVLDGLVLFGPQQGLMADPIRTIISAKVALHGIATLQQSLNQFVTLENAANGGAGGSANIVANYDTPDPRITSAL